MAKKGDLSKNKSRGFSLVEVIVSMALIIVLSIVAFSVCNACINVGGKNNIKNYFMIESKNFVTAYFAGNDGYANAMNLLTGQTYTFGEDVTLYYSADFKITNQANSKYKINLVFGDKFEVDCMYADNGTIYKIEV